MNDEERVLFNGTITLNKDLSLSEVKGKIRKTSGQDTMTVKELRRTGTIVAAQKVCDCRLEVYDNGFAACLKPCHETVLRMEYVHSEMFEGDPNVGLPDKKYNLAKDNWGEAVMFAGEKRMEERHEQWVNETQVPLIRNEGAGEEGGETDIDPASAVDVEVEVVNQDEKEQLWSKVGGFLTKRQMEIVKLHVEDELGWTEIGKRLGIKPGSVQGTFDRALAKLQANKKFFEEFL